MRMFLRISTQPHLSIVARKQVLSFFGWCRCCRRRCRFFVQNGFNRQADTATLVGFHHFNAHLLAFLQVIAHVGNPLVGNLADMHQTITPWHDLDNRPDVFVENLHDRAFVDTTHFNIGSNRFDTALRGFCTFVGGGGNGNQAIFTNVGRNTPSTSSLQTGSFFFDSAPS